MIFLREDQSIGEVVCVVASFWAIWCLDHSPLLTFCVRCLRYLLGFSSMTRSLCLRVKENLHFSELCASRSGVSLAASFVAKSAASLWWSPEWAMTLCECRLMFLVLITVMILSQVIQ